MAYKESFKDRLDDLMMKNFEKQIRQLIENKSVKLKTCVAKIRFWRSLRKQDKLHIHPKIIFNF